MGESFNDCKKMEGPGRRFLKHLAAKLEPVIVAWILLQLSSVVALIAWFTMNGMCAKNKYIYAWRKQAIIEWSWRGSSADINLWTIQHND